MKSRSMHGLWSGMLLGLCACQGITHAEVSVTAAPPSDAVGPSGECGGRGQADCPLQGWMKSTVQTYQRDKNYRRLANALEELAAHTPEGYANWKEQALAGAAAANNKDDSAVSKSCKGCHNEHRTRFRKERRAQPLF
jgi:hypothetical protein